MTRRPPSLSYAAVTDVAPAATPAGRAAVVGLLVLGVVCGRLLFGPNYMLLLTLGGFGWAGLVLLAVAAVAVAATPPVGGPLARGLDRLSRPPTPAGRRRGGLVVAGLTYAFLLATASGQHRPTWPTLHDEFSYLIQARQFAAFHLWYRPHPLADFFDNFQLFARPVYASAYFPGTALLYVPGVWLHVPAYLTSLAVAAAVAGLLYRVVAELLDPLWAGAAVLLLWCVSPYRAASTMTLAQLPLLLYCLTAVGLWLGWRTTGRRRDLVGVGLCLGLAAVTRPVDAVCFAVPIGVDLLVAVGRRPGPLLRTAAVLLAGLLPPLLLQLTLDRGVTGRWTETPFRLYADRDYPGTAYGFAPPPPDARPASPLPQKQSLYREYQPLIAQHTPGNVWHQLVAGFGDAGLSPPRLSLTATLATPVPLILLFPLLFVAPLAAAADRRRRRWGLLATGPLFLALYAGYVFFFPHYTLTAAPAVLLAVAAAARHVAGVVPRRVSAAVPTLLFGIALAALPQWDASLSDDPIDAPTVAAARSALSHLPPGPAVVLFTWDAARSNHDEPAYTADAPWPDDAPVVRAHDLGPARDRELFRYYAEHQPARVAYRFDERTGELTRLGAVSDLSR